MVLKFFPHAHIFLNSLKWIKIHAMLTFILLTISFQHEIIGKENKLSTQIVITIHRQAAGGQLLVANSLSATSIVVQ